MSDIAPIRRAVIHNSFLESAILTCMGPTGWDEYVSSPIAAAISGPQKTCTPQAVAVQ